MTPTDSAEAKCPACFALQPCPSDVCEHPAKDHRFDYRRVYYPLAGKDPVAAEAKCGHCPACGSPSPKLHPAIQSEGEVRLCSHEFHSATGKSLATYSHALPGSLAEKFNLYDRDRKNRSTVPPEEHPETHADCDVVLAATEAELSYQRDRAKKAEARLADRDAEIFELQKWKTLTSNLGARADAAETERDQLRAALSALLLVAKAQQVLDRYGNAGGLSSHADLDGQVSQIEQARVDVLNRHEAMRKAFALLKI